MTPSRTRWSCCSCADTAIREAAEEIGLAPDEIGLRVIGELELMLNAKVNRFITVGLGGILLYDYDQDSGAQLSQVFNLGFAFSYQNFEEPKK